MNISKLQSARSPEIWFPLLYNTWDCTLWIECEQTTTFLYQSSPFLIVALFFTYLMTWQSLKMSDTQNSPWLNPPELLSFTSHNRQGFFTTALSPSLWSLPFDASFPSNVLVSPLHHVSRHVDKAREYVIWRESDHSLPCLCLPPIRSTPADAFSPFFQSPLANVAMPPFYVYLNSFPTHFVHYTIQFTSGITFAQRLQPSHCKFQWNMSHIIELYFASSELLAVCISAFTR